MYMEENEQCEFQYLTHQTIFVNLEEKIVTSIINVSSTLNIK